MAGKQAMNALIAKYQADRQKYSLDLEKRDLPDVVREFNVLLIKLDAGIPNGANDDMVAQIMADRNNAIDEFIKYLQNKKY